MRGEVLDFPTFFQAATGHAPFPYQERLALAEKLPELVRAPTGAGKTAAVVLGWLWRRRFAAPGMRATTPRRLAYCLPMRVLVEQTAREARVWLGNLAEGYPQEMAEPPSVHVLMGGEETEDWHLRPEADAILVGTQDMLLSRALNRGYGASRFRWPQEFGLLHNDCLWVMDEVQLMGPGLATSCQLEAFRKAWGAWGPSRTVWMSATSEPGWLRTVDHAPPSDAFGLEAADLAHPGLRERMRARKRLERAKAVLRTATKADVKAYAEQVAAQAAGAHHAGALTLVVLNTVDRAVAVHRALQQAGVEAELRLVHSRFRPHERKQWAFLAKDAPVPAQGRIVVATQVVEAGVDVSARALLTELAPWSSVVQRLGRCNRYGEAKQASAVWIDLDTRKDAGLAAPYGAEELDEARSTLRKLEGQDAGPEALGALASGAAAQVAHVLRRRDLLDLFDTTPDLSGNDIDVGRFIRDGDDLDALVFWRDFQGEPEEKRPRREELCPVPVGSLREFLKDHEAWTWDHLEDRWRALKVKEARPGLQVLLRCDAGGYDPQCGWDPATRQRVEPLPAPEQREEAHDADPGALGRDRKGDPYWQNLIGHARRTAWHAARLTEGLADLNLPQHGREAVVLAARFHDAGKGHHVFQDTLLRPLSPEERSERATQLWAKSDHDRSRHHRRGFRHELAGALALRSHPPPGWAEEALDLTCYLVAAHHGKVRLALRALPTEQPSDVRGCDACRSSLAGGKPGRFSRGVWEGDEMPAIDLGDGFGLPATRLSLACMELGLGEEGPSWQERALALREAWGPFKLALLEALVVAADRAATRDPGEEGVKRG